MKKLLATLAFGLAILPYASGAALAHGCHREPAESRSGLHRHVGPYCERLEVRPYRGEHHHHDDRDYRRGPPECVKKCHYVGPFKQCDTICR
jgi:hypothetical protein